MRLPRVNPVGLVEKPAEYVTAPRSYPVALRVVTVVLLGAFVFVGVTTTVLSLGTYCLTSQAGAPFRARPRSASRPQPPRADVPPLASRARRSARR